MELTVAQAQDMLFQDVLGADADAVEAAVINRRTTGEKDIAEVVTNLANVFDSPKRDVYAVLGTSSSKVSRRPQMNVEVLDRAGAALALYVRIAAMIGDENAAGWFKDPNPHLAGKRPIDRLGSNLGRQRLASMIISLEDGTFL